MIAGPPETPVAIPVAVRQLAANSSVRAVWRNGLGGITFEIDEDPCPPVHEVGAGEQRPRPVR